MYPQIYRLGFQSMQYKLIENVVRSFKLVVLLKATGGELVTRPFLLTNC